jgi:RNA polymerase sigma-70 factor (sigma-E family)
VDPTAEREFEAFVASAGARLLRAAYLISGNAPDAEDLHQVVLERVARRWGQISGDPEAYARVVLAHAATDRWRRRRARPREQFGEVDPDPAVGVDGAAAVDTRLDVVRMLRGLPRQQRLVLVLRYFYDLTEADTASELGVSIGTIKGTTSRALANLRNASTDGMGATP